MVDAISAEDIGKFPDTNLAESLQRITGVSISRVNGEGSQVTVRGFSGGFNLVTLNGRQLPASNVDTSGSGAISKRPDCASDSALSESTGSTQGIRLRISPPSSASASAAKSPMRVRGIAGVEAAGDVDVDAATEAASSAAAEAAEAAGDGGVVVSVIGRSFLSARADT